MLIIVQFKKIARQHINHHYKFTEFKWEIDLAHNSSKENC